MSTLRRSALISSSSQWIMFAITFVKMAVVSRLLTPDQIGTFTLAASLVFLAQFLRIFGTLDYIIARKELTHEDLRHCFTITVVAGLGMTTLFLSLSWPLAWVYDSTDLALLIWIMVPSFLILPIGSVTLAVMQREMRLMELSVIRMAATLTDTGVTIALALWGLGVASLGWGYAAGNVVTILVLVALTRQALLYRPLFQGMGAVLQFGLPSALGTFLSQVGTSGPPLLLGLGANTATVGLFGRGQTLITFFRQGIEFSTRPVTQAWFAQKNRTDPSLIAEGYLRITALISGIAWPVYVGLFFGAPTLVPLLLGNQWGESIPVAQILALGGFLSFYQSSGVSVLEGLGRMGQRLRFNVALQAARFALLGLALVFGGLLVFSAALALSHAVGFVLITAYLKADTGLRFRDVARVQVPSALVAGAMAVVSAVMFWGVFDDAALSLWELGLYVLVMSLVWGAGIWGTGHPLLLEARGILERRRA